MKYNENVIQEEKDEQGAQEGAAENAPGESESSRSGVDSGDISRRTDGEDWKDKYIRKLAEFDNFRKRTRAEAGMLREAAVESVVSGLLPALDDFDRMLGGMAESNDPYRKGVELICGKLWSHIHALGVERMECLGKAFDPAEHEALAVQPTRDFPPGTVLTVVAPGYRLHGRVIRHAQVIVSGEMETAATTAGSDPAPAPGDA